MSRLEQQKKLSRKRVINEYKKLLKAKQEVGVMAEPNADNICNWDATMLGSVYLLAYSKDHRPFVCVCVLREL